MSVTMIKDLAKAVRERQEQLKARQEQEAKQQASDSGTRKGQPPDPESGPAPDSPDHDK